MPFMPEDIKKRNQKTGRKTNLSTNKGGKKVDTISDVPKAVKASKKVETRESLIKEKPAQQVKDKEKTPPEAFSHPLFSWQASEYTFYKKSPLWYFVILVLALLCIGAAIYFRQWILIAVIVMFVIVLIQYSRRKPEMRNYALNEQGIKIDDKTYSFKQFKSFWIIKTAEETSLNLEPLKRLSPIITISLSGVRTEDLRQILVKYLPEQKREEELIDRISKKLKF
jgi:hypothetical protein